MEEMVSQLKREYRMAAIDATSKIEVSDAPLNFEKGVAIVDPQYSSSVTSSTSGSLVLSIFFQCVIYGIIT
jgi:hypothetical protein